MWLVSSVTRAEPTWFRSKWGQTEVHVLDGETEDKKIQHQVSTRSKEHPKWISLIPQMALQPFHDYS